MHRIVAAVVPLGLAGVVCLLVAWVTAPATSRPPGKVGEPRIESTDQTVVAVDRYFEERWRGAEVTPTGAADDLQLYRRLSLVLHGTIPSLQEIREFESDREPERIERWTERLLQDKRFPDYFSQRLSRFLAGTEIGQFIVFRRDRFNAWLSEELRKSRPYDEMVRRMISKQGLWTGEPETNFVTAAVSNGNLDVNELTGRTVRAFLGQRIDCAQCHDHPFDHWKQGDFEGIAAYYGQTKQSVAGIEDKSKLEYRIEDRKTLQERLVNPKVPHHPEWCGTKGTRREKLAAWVTHPENRAFERAVANRMWGLMFGRPWIDPVDGLPDPPEQEDLLDILGSDFRRHNCDLKRMIRVIVSSKVFRLDSKRDGDQRDGDGERETEKLAAEWGMYPMSRLRPEQVIGAMLQGASVRTIDQNSNLLVRTIRFFREQDFVRDYGNIEGEELEERAGTIPQVLRRMNGKLTRE